MTMIAQRVSTIFITCVLYVGCAHDVPLVKEQLAEERLGPLEDGTTKMDEVLLRFGIPSAWFQGEKILTYRMMLDDDELVVVTRELDGNDPRISQWKLAEYSLVLVFNDDHVLQKHSLVKVR
jgi:hypothetical protein